MVELNHGDEFFFNWAKMKIQKQASESMLYLTLSMRSDLNSWDRLYYLIRVYRSQFIGWMFKIYQYILCGLYKFDSSS